MACRTVRPFPVPLTVAEVGPPRYDRGVMVSKVLEETPAALAGIEVGDVLITADGAPIDNAGDVSEVLAGKGDGSAAAVRELTGAEMSLAMGRPNVIHAAAAEGGATRRLI